jgi:hypothetical protein
MIDEDPVAVLALQICRDHATTASGDHRRAKRRRPVDTGMETRHLEDGVHANAKAGT